MRLKHHLNTHTHARLARAQREGVEYSLRLVPLGGYVAFPDDDPESKFDKGEEGGGVGRLQAPWWSRRLEGGA